MEDGSSLRQRGGGVDDGEPGVGVPAGLKPPTSICSSSSSWAFLSATAANCCRAVGCCRGVQASCNTGRISSSSSSIMGAMVGETQPVGVGVLPGEPVESILLPTDVESRTTRSIGSTMTLPRLSLSILSRLSLSIGSRMTEETVEL